MSFLKRAWNGTAPLWIVFWGGLLLPQVVGGIVGVILSLYFSSAGYDRDSVQMHIWQITHSVAWNLVWLIFFVLLSVAVWRCAFNIRHSFGGYAKMIGYVARIAVIAMVVVVTTMILGSLQRPQQAEFQPIPGAENLLNPDNNLMPDFMTIPDTGQEAPADPAAEPFEEEQQVPNTSGVKL